MDPVVAKRQISTGDRTKMDRSIQTKTAYDTVIRTDLPALAARREPIPTSNASALTSVRVSPYELGTTRRIAALRFHPADVMDDTGSET